MAEFFADVRNYTFLQYALLTAVLAPIACGIVGSFVTVRRITYIAAAISHCILGGMGAGLYLQRVRGWEFLTPLYGAVFGALAAAIIIGLVTLYGKQREDTVLSTVWVLGMAIGIFFISKTSGYYEDLMSYLFGNILLVAKEDPFLIAGLDAVIVIVSLLFYNKLQAICFDEECARLRGVSVGFYYLLLLCLTALTVVLLVEIVGIVLVIALLTLPAATAAHFARRLWHMMIIAIILCMLFTTGGIALSYGPDLPVGPTIISLAGGVYLSSLIAKSLWKFLRKRGQA